MRVHIDPPDDHEDRAPTPLGVKVRYAIAMAAFFVVAVGATIAIRNTNDLSTTSHRTATLAHANQTLTLKVEKLTHANHRLVKRVADDEHATCVIQARGLPAGHQLATSMGDFYQILTLLLKEPHAKNAAPTPPRLERLVIGLDIHLGKYIHAEAKQPAHRGCKR